MQNDKKEKTAQISSVDTDEKQSIQNRSTIITQNDVQINSQSMLLQNISLSSKME